MPNAQGQLPGTGRRGRGSVYGLLRVNPACRQCRGGVFPRRPWPVGARAHEHTMQRKVLVILSNRFRPLEEPRYMEILCKDDGTILKERRLPRRPSRPVFDEVWENDDARQSLDSCKSVKRHYKHPLLKPKK
jgi:hypothetical protein